MRINRRGLNIIGPPLCLAMSASLEWGPPKHQISPSPAQIWPNMEQVLTKIALQVLGKKDRNTTLKIDN